MVNKIRVLVLGVFLFCISGFVWVKKIEANGLQICKLGSSCVIGEFLYDDNYAPVNSDAVCTLTTRKPDNNIWLDGVSLSIGTSDGWYSYSIDTSGQNEGFYPSQVCCTIGTGSTEYMCLDKSFQLESAALTSLGTLPDNISSIYSVVNSIDSQVGSLGNNITSILTKWDSYSVSDIINNINNVTMSLGTNSDNCSINSVFGNISCIKDKWGSQTADSLYTVANNALNVGNSLRSELNYNGKSTNAYDDLQAIKNYVNTLEISIGNSNDLSSATTLFGKVKNNQEMVLGVQTSLNTSTSNIRADISNIKTVVDSINGKIDTISGNVASLLGKWGSYSVSDILNNVSVINNSIGNYSDSCSTNSVFGNIACVKDKWGSQSAQTLYEAASGALSIGTSLRAELNYNGKSTTAYADLQTLKAYVDTLESSIGSESDLSSAATLFGRIKSNKEDIAAVPTNVWGYTQRTLTNFGTLVSDIWNYTSRSLSNFGSLIADIWGNSTRTLTAGTLNSGQLATLNEVNSLGTSLTASTENIRSDISNVSDQILGTQTSLASLSSKIDSINSQTSVLSGKVDNLINKWGSYTVSDVISNISTIKSSIGVSGDVCGSSNTIFGGIACLQNSSSSGDSSNILTAVENVETLIGNLQNELNYNGKSTTAYADVQTIKTNIETIIGAIGNSNDSATMATLFGRMKKVSDKVEALDGINYQATTVIDNWGTLSPTDIYNKVKDLSSEISAINTVSNVSTILALGQTNATDITVLKNQLLTIQALVAVNKDLMEKVVDKPIVKTWLEDGSVIFKTMVTNPSTSRQNASVKFYLPKEATQKDIIKVDEGASVNYDSGTESLYVSGDFSLAPKETKIISVEITDIWKISETEIESLKVQSEELIKALDKTAYYAQGITLKSDITVLLESISRTQKEAVTPNERIQSYRDNIQKLVSVKNEIKELKNLVTSLSSNSIMSGFVGGAQSFSLWGMAIVIVMSVMAMMLYIRFLVKKNGLRPLEKIKEIGKNGSKINFKKTGIVMSLILAWFSVFGATYQGFDALFKSKKASTVIQKVEKIKEEAVVKQSNNISQNVSKNVENDQEMILGASTKEQIKVAPPKDFNSSLKIRENPEMDSTILGKIWYVRTVDKYAESDGWVKIGTSLNVDGEEKYITGWIRNQYVEK